MLNSVQRQIINITISHVYNIFYVLIVISTGTARIFLLGAEGETSPKLSKG
jgi:hypothetical protein